MVQKTNVSVKRNAIRRGAGIVLNLALIAVAVAFGPVENTLGASVRLVYLHGAWVEAGKYAFGLAALAGLVGLLPFRSQGAQTAQRSGQSLSLAVGRSGLFFWLTYLPMSLLVMQATWGGFFFDEPRWRVPLMFGVVGALLQAGLYLLNSPRLACLANLVYGVVLWVVLGGLTNVLHPDSPIFNSGSPRIEFYFIMLLALTLFLGMQITVLFWVKINPTCASRLPSSR